MSIFYKDCPHCATTHAAAADVCSCGYVFSGEKRVEPDLAPELAAQEEKLYEAYLAARLEQAAQEARTARKIAADDPLNGAKADAARHATAVMDMAQAEFDTQAAKTAEAVKMAEIAKTTRAIKGRSLTNTAKATAIIHRAPAAETKKGHAAAHTPKSAKKAAMAAKPVKNKKSDPTEEHRTKARIAEQANVGAKRAAEEAQTQRDEQARREAKEAMDAKLRASQAEQAKHARLLAEQARQAELAKLQTEQDKLQAEAARAARAYLAAQAAKAEQAVKAMQAAKIRERAAESQPPGAAFKAAQAVRAAHIMQAETKECPNCTGSVAHDTSRCGCGFVFTNGDNEMPGLSLSPAEQSELLRHVKLSTSTKR